MFKKINRSSYNPGWPTWLFTLAITAFGLALLLWPNAASSLIVNGFGGILLGVGIFHIIRYYSRSRYHAMSNMDLGIGISFAFLGVLVFLLKDILLSIIPALIGIFLLITGFIKIQAALDFKRLLVNRWYLEMIASGVSIIMGLIIILNPFSTAMVLIRIIGGAILVEGIQDTISLFAYKKVYKTYFVD